MKKKFKKKLLFYFILLLITFCISHFVNADSFSSSDYRIFEMSSSNYYAFPFQSGSFDNIDANKPFNISVIWSDVNLPEYMPSTINLEFAVSDNNFSLAVFNRTSFCNATIKKSTAKYSGQFSDVYKVILTLSSTKALGDSSFTDRECHLQMIPQNWTRFMFIGATNDTSIDIDNNKETNTKLDNINSSLTDSSPISLEKLNDTAGWLPEGPIDSILNLPLSLLNNLSTNLNKQCTPVSLTIPFIDKNNTLVLPCLANTLSDNVENFDSFYTWLGLTVSCILLYKYLMSLYVWVDKVLTLRLQMYEDFGGDPHNFGSV